MQELKNKTDILKRVKREGNFKHFIYKGVSCYILRPSYILTQGNCFHLCGYIYLPPHIPLKPYDKYDVSVHGGLTYSADELCIGKKILSGKFIGFDCAHLGDIAYFLEDFGVHILENETYKTMTYVKEELKSLVKQILGIYHE